MNLFSILYIFSIIASILILLRTSLPPNIGFNTPKMDHTVSIIIPARNEENNIKRSLDSILKQTYPIEEIIVVDGNSTDNTRNIVQSYSKVSLLLEPNRPKTWVGKPWACYNGYLQAKGDTLLFTDADTWHHPKSLETTLSQLEDSKGLLSLVTTQELFSFWEYILVIVFMIISVSVKGTRGNSGVMLANGQYMLFKRETYEKLGTHKVVKSSIIEDLELGTIANENGVPPSIVYKKGLVKARMYNSLSEINEGFTKNLGLGVEKVGIIGILNTSIVTIWGMGWILLIVINYNNLTRLIWMVAILGYTSFVVFLLIVEHSLTGSITYRVLIYPLYFVIFWGITTRSIIHTFFGKTITWKGINYKTTDDD